MEKGGGRPDLGLVRRGAQLGNEVMDARGPVPDSEAADADLSLMSFLDYRESAFWQYPKLVTGADYQETFHCLTFPPLWRDGEERPSRVSSTLWRKVAVSSFRKKHLRLSSPG